MVEKVNALFPVSRLRVGRSIPASDCWSDGPRPSTDGRKLPATGAVVKTAGRKTVAVSC